VYQRKTQNEVKFYGERNYKKVCKGYEIHMGKTLTKDNNPVNYLLDGKTDGFMLNEKCFGTYMHGILE